VLNKAGVKMELLDTVEARKLAYYGYTMRKQQQWEFPSPPFPGPCCKPAMFKYRDKQQLLTTYMYSKIAAASILEYMFITVMCCEEIANYFGVCVGINA